MEIDKKDEFGILNNGIERILKTENISLNDLNIDIQRLDNDKYISVISLDINNKNERFYTLEPSSIHKTLDIFSRCLKKKLKPN